LVDSGSDVTVIPRRMALDLGLQPSYEARSQGVEETGRDVTLFSAMIAVENEKARFVDVLVWDEEFALLGRDIINRWVMTFDGPGFTLKLSR